MLYLNSTNPDSFSFILLFFRLQVLQRIYPLLSVNLKKKKKWWYDIMGYIEYIIILDRQVVTYLHAYIYIHTLWSLALATKRQGFFSLEIFLLEASRETSSCLFLNEITKTGFWISCLYRIMVMYQQQLQDLPAFLKVTSALVAAVSINAGVLGKGCNETACCWKSKQSQIRLIF